MQPCPSRSAHQKSVRNMLLLPLAWKVLLDEFKNSEEVPFKLVREKSLIRPDPDKVLREATSQFSGKRCLVPADSAMTIVVRYALLEDPSLSELRAMLKLPRRDPTDSGATLVGNSCYF